MRREASSWRDYLRDCTDAEVSAHMRGNYLTEQLFAREERDRRITAGTWEIAVTQAYAAVLGECL